VERLGFKMKFSLQGRIKNIQLKKKDILLTLFEAIDNSIDSIVAHPEREIFDGEIRVTLIRNKLALPNSGVDDSITGFEIWDNGIGFTPENFESFNTADSTYKRALGGKGNGRFIWLKAFSNVEITSVYKNETYHLRKFTFNLNNPYGIEEKVHTAFDKKETWCKVELKNCEDTYISSIPRDAEKIAIQIVYHFLKSFLNNMMPQMFIVDGDDNLDIFTYYQQIVESEFNTDRFFIRKKEFCLTQGLVKYQSGLKHELSLCAKNRPVKTLPITSKKIRNLNQQIMIENENGEEEKFVYLGLVTSKYLDEKVTSTRDDFFIYDHEEGSIEFDNELTNEEMYEGIYAHIESYLHEYLHKIQEEKIERIKKYIRSESPQYKFIEVNHPERIENIPPGLSNREIEHTLNEIAFDLRKEFKDESEKIKAQIIDSTPSSAEELEDLNTHLYNYLEKSNDIGKSSLAQYIIYRKSILDLLDTVIRANDEKKFDTEKVFHTFIFPMNKSSDDIGYEEHNLWVIDEKLAYNSYIASDMTLKKNKVIESNSQNRPDLFVHTFSTVDVEDADAASLFNALDIFEFKRPMRNDYSDNENPIKQLYDYLELIRGGNAKTKDRRMLNIAEGAIIRCFAICDITPKLKQILRNYDYQQIGQEPWYIGFHDSYKAYIEVKDISLMINESKKRNKILFDKLGL
jgi:hypothetical protein